MTRPILMSLLLMGCASGPVSGTWLYTSSELVSDSCDAFEEDAVLMTGDFFVYNEGKGSLVIDPNDDTDVLTCTYGGDTFDCDEQIEAEEVIQGNALTGTSQVSGTMSGREAASGTNLLEITCEGEGCAAFEQQSGQSFPCTAEVTFTAEWTSPTLPE